MCFPQVAVGSDAAADSRQQMALGNCIAVSALAPESHCRFSVGVQLIPPLHLPLLSVPEDLEMV